MAFGSATFSASVLGSARSYVIIGQADGVINGMDGQAGEEARIERQRASEFRRDHPLIATLGAVLGLSGDEIDTLSIAASNL